jgi:hypothetical protein
MMAPSGSSRRSDEPGASRPDARGAPRRIGSGSPWGNPVSERELRTNHTHRVGLTGGPASRMASRQLQLVARQPVGSGVPVTSAPTGTAIVVPVTSAPLSSGPVRSAPSRQAPRRSAPRRSAPRSEAPVKFALRNEVPAASAPARSRPRRSTVDRSAPARRAPRRSAVRSSAATRTHVSYLMPARASKRAAGPTPASLIPL